MGKTNAFLPIISGISKNLTSMDVMLIFDTKGEFYEIFGDPSDIVISNSKKLSSLKKNIWNIFEELDADKLNETSNEISAMLFASHVEKTSNSFFPLAARAIFGAVLRAIYRIPADKLVSAPSNKLLKDFFNGKNIYAASAFIDEDPGVHKNIVNLLDCDPKERGVLGYISRTTNAAPDPQTLGVLAELRIVVDEVFIGNFEKEGSFSVRKAIKERKGKRIFVEYDIEEGETLSGIYSLLIDLAIKESLSPNNAISGANAYFVIDEFKLLPHLKHVDDAVNFGRSQGVKFVIGVQNVSQMMENYGEYGAMNMLSGFSTVFAFRASDHATRNYLVELFGTNRKRTTVLSAVRSRGIIESFERANVVEDWDILELGVGDCIVRLPAGLGNGETPPFFFHTAEFKIN